MKTLLILLAASLSAHALPRTSATYTLSPETTNADGAPTSSASYPHEGSLGESAGTAKAASPSVTVLGGYIGALDVVGLVPGVTTSLVTDHTETGATLSGEVTAEGSCAVTARGFVVVTSPDPTAGNDIVVIVGSKTGSFTVPVIDLSPGTTHHLRAYTDPIEERKRIISPLTRKAGTIRCSKTAGSVPSAGHPSTNPSRLTTKRNAPSRTPQKSRIGSSTGSKSPSRNKPSTPDPSSKSSPSLSPSSA